MKKILTIFGTRPEAIKLAPVIRQLEKSPNEFDSIVGVTGQHDEILNQVLNFFDIKPDFNLSVMRKNQTLTDLTASILSKLGRILSDIRPDVMLVQGDTTTVLAATLAAFYQKIHIGHVEAGLRTFNKYQPFPEEINRRLADQMSDIFFAPTETNRRNLLREGIPVEKVFVTGNTVIDALLDISRSRGQDTTRNQMILVTLHRRESFGEPLCNVLQALKILAEEHKGFQFVYPVHPNPNVWHSAHKVLSGIDNVTLTEPLDYFSFIELIRKAYLILTDSGGVQEEAPSFHKPVLVLRNKTERPEGIEAGCAKLVGTDRTNIISEVKRLIDDKEHYRRMSTVSNPYGDGFAAKRIVDILKNFEGGKR